MFFSGIIKYLFVPLAMTVAFAMMADYAVSMTVTPVTLARLYRRDHSGQEGSAESGWFAAIINLYEQVLRLCLRVKPLVLGGALALLVATAGVLVPQLHTEFFPKVDAGNFTMIVVAPEGSRIEKTTAIVDRIEAMIRDII